jgi:hypothetical protein
VQHREKHVAVIGYVRFCVTDEHVLFRLSGGWRRPARWPHFRTAADRRGFLFQQQVQVQVDTGGGYRLVGTPVARCGPLTS